MSTIVEFWGVRGSIPVSSPLYTYFGGHTSCVSVTHDQNIFIFDAGTGLRDLGKKLKEKNINQATLILSHMHFDHILGLPFFEPIWDSNFQLTLLSSHCYEKEGIKEFLKNYIFNDLLFPVKLDQVSAKINYIDCPPSENLTFFEDYHLKIAPLNHPGGGYGYQLRCPSGSSIAYISDTEHTPGDDDLEVLKLMQGADLVIYDAMYTEEQFSQKRGWGHSTWAEGLRLAQKAQAKRLALYHHNPNHTDDILLKIEEDAKKIWSSCFMARQGMEIFLP
ncbi:MAG: MBL fold metallo-hydrolase [Candidatus Paracaedimonas acanthamoebae]|uniref:MBL fold metallo-hydrolase n=1 Tax=Candidatus Paracaedimonas acanthamoebae TaxID=244581 RepID=A0A8J7PJV2_9PROT|nr:MBL fold metallo-hydrolase [Candidatus Paracaedimonas acanthamoebae]